MGPIDDADGAWTVTSWTRAEARLTGAKPLLDDTPDRSLTMHVRTDKSAATDTGKWPLRSADPTGVEDIKTAASRAG